MTGERSRLAVLGTPIAHSLSPALHRAAYRVLRLPWEYGQEAVDDRCLAGFLARCDASWRGLSLTMPLKQAVLPHLVTRTVLVERTGAANTVYFTDAGAHGYNTDVDGAANALREAGVAHVAAAAIVGGGATAASVLCALHALGLRRVGVFVREAGRVSDLLALAASLGVHATVAPLTSVAEIADVDLVVSCLPGGVDIGVTASAAVRTSVPLFDVAYAPWPTPLAGSWLDVGGTVVNGRSLLLHQALLQVRIFVTGEIAEPLPHECAVLNAMRTAIE